MVHMLVEENYAGNNRIDLILEGIRSVIRKKRIYIKQYRYVEEIDKSVRVVIVICASLKWATDTVEKLNDMGIHPLLFGFQYIDTMYRYSCVTLTYTKTMYLLTGYLLSKNPGNTALLGYNSDSLPDRLKLIGVRYATDKYGVECKVYKNEGDVRECIENFAKESEGIKNIVCANDGIAVILRGMAPDLLKDRLMCSCSGMRVSEFTPCPHPTSIINYFKAGVQLAELYFFLLRCEEISATVIQLEMDIEFGKGEIDGEMPAIGMVYSRRTVDFYGDSLIREVDGLDRMLIQCDETDMAILRHITKGMPYEDIAEFEHLALNTVKYRIHAMLKNAELESRKDLLSVIRKYGLIFE